jgi:lysophospholipase L1-like esterase
MKTPLLCSLLLLTTCAAFAEPSVTAVTDVPKDLRSLRTSFQGRAVEAIDSWKYQWPGTYSEVNVTGTEVFFRAGPEPSILSVSVDGKAIGTLARPVAGFYRVAGLAPGRHVVRVTSVSENQAGPVTFAGFAARPPTKQMALAPKKHQIEFIGDSHTVGYGNTSGKRECTEDEVWSTTDTSKSFGPLIARHYDADYQVNAISGRGIVRNYGGFKADPLPVVYPFVLFDKAAAYRDPKWNPQVIVIALGTNDFSTPLNAGEPWSTREALHADYETTYLKFLRSLRERNPRALIILWATDMADGEIAAEEKKVAEKFVAAGDKQTFFLPVNGLTFSACNWHPSTQDDQTIADALIKLIDSHAPGFQPR